MRRAIAGLLLLAACETTQPPFIPAADFDQQPASVTFQLNFVRGSAALAPGEQQLEQKAATNVTDLLREQIDGQTGE